VTASTAVWYVRESVTSEAVRAELTNSEVTIKDYMAVQVVMCS
jgi:hypothetical protein